MSSLLSKDSFVSEFIYGWHLCTDFVFRFSSRQTHALLCLNNLFGSLDTAAFGGVEKLYPVWQGLVTLSKEQNCKLHDFIFNINLTFSGQNLSVDDKLMMFSLFSSENRI